MIIWISISFSFSVHLFLHRPRTQNSRIIGQYTHNLLGLKTLSFSVLLFIHKNMDKRSPNWVRHAKCTWSSLLCLVSFNFFHTFLFWSILWWRHTYITCFLVTGVCSSVGFQVDFVERRALFCSSDFFDEIQQRLSEENNFLCPQKQQ